MKFQRCLHSIRVQNYKAIQDSKSVKLTPLTVLIGNNGSGKSSLVEAMEAYRNAVVEDLDKAFASCFGFQHVWNKRSRHNLIGERAENPISFAWLGRLPNGKAKAGMAINTRPAFNGLYIEQEDWLAPVEGAGVKKERDQSSLPRPLREFIADWQFISLMPDRMGVPAPKRMSALGGSRQLHRDGSNLAQYLAGIRAKDVSAFNGIVETMKFVLSYATDFQPVETQEIQRTLYFRMKENEYDIPAWMFSTGTLRVLALLAVLRNPDPPPLVVIEEIENGLDPRTIHMVLDEIREAVQSGSTQVIVTTHSPYFLNLVPIQSLVLVERSDGGQPVFWRPGDQEKVQDWAKTFSPGDLYTAGRFQREAKK